MCSYGRTRSGCYQRLETWVADTGASESMTLKAESMLNFVELHTFMHSVNGVDLAMALKSNGGCGHVNIRNVAHVPPVAYNLLSLKPVTDNGYDYVGRRDGIMVNLAGKGDIYFTPKCGLRAIRGVSSSRPRKAHARQCSSSPGTSTTG